MLVPSDFHVEAAPHFGPSDTCSFCLHTATLHSHLPTNPHLSEPLTQGHIPVGLHMLFHLHADSFFHSGKFILDSSFVVFMLHRRLFPPSLIFPNNASSRKSSQPSGLVCAPTVHRSTRNSVSFITHSPNKILYRLKWIASLRKPSPMPWPGFHQY